MVGKDKHAIESHKVTHFSIFPKSQGQFGVVNCLKLINHFVCDLKCWYRYSLKMNSVSSVNLLSCMNLLSD